MIIIIMPDNNNNNNNNNNKNDHDYKIINGILNVQLSDKRFNYVSLNIHKLHSKQGTGQKILSSGRR